jgi:hypothetical protein
MFFSFRVIKRLSRHVSFASLSLQSQLHFTMCRRQRVRDTERQLASLQTALAEQHKQHERQSAQLSNEADAKVQLVKVLQEQAFELQRRLTAQRCKFEATLLHSPSRTL